MAKIKVAEATVLQLNWLVAILEGHFPHMRIDTERKVVAVCLDDWNTARYAKDWAQGGPIIEREKIVFDFYPDGGHANGGEWLANTPAYKTDAGVPLEEEFGPTPLIAAMRCYVASKLGEEVEVPDELAV